MSQLLVSSVLMASGDGVQVAFQRRAMSTTEGATQATTGRRPRPLEVVTSPTANWDENAGDENSQDSFASSPFPGFKLEHQTSLSAPSSPRSLARRDDGPPLSSAIFKGRFSSASTPKLQAYARSPTYWVDPNELHIDLTTVARHRHRRGRCFPTSATAPGTMGTQHQREDEVSERPHDTKRSHRSQRTERLQALFSEMSRKHEA